MKKRLTQVLGDLEGRAVHSRAPLVTPEQAAALIVDRLLGTE
jgi:hypothetical protein